MVYRRFSCPYYVAVMLILFCLSTAVAQETENSESDEVITEKIADKSLWEKIVDFPGDVIALPPELLLKTIEKTIVVVDKTKIVPKVVDRLTADSGLFGLRPTYSGRTGAGAYYFHNSLFNKTSRLKFTATSSFDFKRRLVELKQSNFSFGNTMFNAGYLLRYSSLDGEYFFGLGPNTSIDDEYVFGYGDRLAEFNIGAKVNEFIDLDITSGFAFNKTWRAKNSDHQTVHELYTEETLPGVGNHAKLLHTGLTLDIEKIDHRGHPTQGNELKLYTALYNTIDDKAYGFWKAAFDYTWYMHLFYDRLLSLRFAAETTEPLDGKTIPFYYLSELGEQETIRGYDRGRFRGRDMMLGSIEYRYPVWRQMSIYLFTDAGKVMHAIEDEFNADDLQYGYGAGLRVFNNGGLILKTEVGISDEKTRFYFTLNKGL